MTFVVVFLTDPKIHLVVREDWVRGLNSAKTKNNGNNSNQTWLMYWSGINGKPNDVPLPIDFDVLEIKQEFEPTCEGAAYFCKTLQFEGMKKKF